jgi:ribosomal protein S18 acetylase RimI-like enzyme
MAASDAAPGPRELPLLRLNPDDAGGIWPLSVEAGWNQTDADWRLMIALGSAFGLRDARGRWIASALALPLGPQVSWISMVLVTKAERRRGHGTRLLRHCIAAIAATGSAMGLDATELGRPVYLPLGFRDLYAVSRWSVPTVAAMGIAPPPGIAIRPAGPDDLERIAEYGLLCSGLERRAVLSNLLARAPHLALVAERGGGSLAGFSLGRDGHRATHVGPIMAETQAIGLALLNRALAATGGLAILDVPDRHGTIREWLQSRGASAPRNFMRMLRGSAPAVVDASRIVAIAGPELA